MGSFFESSMMWGNIAALFACAAVALGDDLYAQQQYNQPANYAYQYAVKDENYGVDFSAGESRQAENTEGSYKVLLPDGRVQTVVYTVADAEAGFVADVSFNGEATYAAAPVPVVKAAPVYKAVPPPAPLYRAAPRPVYKSAPVYRRPQSLTYLPAPTPAPADSAPKLEAAPSYRSYSKPKTEEAPKAAAVSYKPRSTTAAPAADIKEAEEKVAASVDLRKNDYKERQTTEATEVLEEREPKALEDTASPAKAAKIKATPAPASTYSGYKGRSTTEAPAAELNLEEREPKAFGNTGSAANAIPDEVSKESTAEDLEIKATTLVNIVRSTTTKAPTTTTTTTATTATTTTTKAPITTTKVPSTQKARSTTAQTTSAAPTTPAAPAASEAASAPLKSTETVEKEITGEAEAEAANTDNSKRWANFVNTYQFYNYNKPYARHRYARNLNAAGAVSYHAQPQIMYGNWQPMQ